MSRVTTLFPYGRLPLQVVALAAMPQHSPEAMFKTRLLVKILYLSVYANTNIFFLHKIKSIFKKSEFSIEEKF